MDLIVRPVEECDLPACLELLRGHLAYPDDVLADLPAVWTRLLHDEALNASALEMQQAGGARSVVAFGASVFVTAAWVAEARRGLEPYLSARTLRRESTGGSPILRPREFLQPQNGTGLNVLVVHYAEAADLPPAIAPQVRYQLFEAFVESCCGYPVRDVVQEFWDEIDPEYVQNGWGRVIADYAGYYEGAGRPLPASGRRPSLVGITRDEVQANPGSIAARLFVHRPARLFLSRGERALLRHAVLGKTDVELAQCLGVSLATVKSRWRGIYDRIDEVAPGLLPEPVTARHPGASRGPERRRRLMEYVRRHPEELHPAFAPRRNGRDA